MGKDETLRDYQGNFEKFKKQLSDAGITEEEFDIEDYAGLTIKELENLVKYEIYRRKGIRI